MRKNLLVLFVLMSALVVSFGQSVKLIEGFDNTATDTTYNPNVEGDLSYMKLSQNTSDKTEGTSSLQINTRIGAYHPWGSYAQLIKRVPDGTYLDWSSSDSLSLWVKVTTPPTNTGYMYFRIHIADRPTSADPIEEYIYEDSTLCDKANGWVNLHVALKERFQEGATVPNDSGFILAPTSWGGFTYNNRKLDFDKIIGYNIAVVTSGYIAPDNIPADSMIFLVDQFERFGNKSVPAILFNGMALASNLSTFTWGQSGFEIVTGGGTSASTNAMKWTMGNEWGNGWTGVGFNISPSFNLAGSWPQDSLVITLKCEDGVGALRAQFESPDPTKTKRVGTVFTPTTDNQWHTYKLALRDMVPQDQTTGFDAANVSVFNLEAEASAIAGKVVYVAELWTGNPVFDVIPPVAVENVNVTLGTFSNLVTWTDVPGETKETYNIYYSKDPITNVKNPGVELVTTQTTKIAEGIQVVEHLLRAPQTNQDVKYYYAISCTDAAGNIGPLTQVGPITNAAKGIAAFQIATPVFKADGDLSEWASIPYQNFKMSDGSAFKVANTVVDNDADCSGKIYLAMDKDNLYVAFDMEDDIVSHTNTTSTYLNDSPDMFIGLYDGHGTPHAGYQRGAQPDYHFRFAFDRLLIDGGKDSVLIPGENYYWGEKIPTGYVVEAKIPFATIQAKSTSDNLFVPAEGMRLPLDFEINDADATGSREGILTYSVYNEDQSWSTPVRWSYAWIGSLWTPTGVNDTKTVVNSYTLSQNYPNPFNPTTRIQYSLERAGFVSLKVYDVLGRLVTTLVNSSQNPGKYSVNFNASHLSSGIYFYKLESGSYNSIKKMMLVK